MAELEFERRLERLFAEAPEMADANAFVDRVARRLDRGWTLRRWMIGAAGVAGGLIGVSQLVMSNMFHEIQHVEGSVRLLSAGLTQIAPRADWLQVLSSGGIGLWIAAALAVVSMGFVLSRVIEEL